MARHLLTSKSAADRHMDFDTVSSFLITYRIHHTVGDGAFLSQRKDDDIDPELQRTGVVRTFILAMPIRPGLPVVFAGANAQKSSFYKHAVQIIRWRPFIWKEIVQSSRRSVKVEIAMIDAVLIGDLLEVPVSAIDLAYAGKGVTP